jgi:hypothetical protein
MNKLHPTGQNQDQVFNFRIGQVYTMHLLCCRAKLPNLKLQTRVKQLLGSLQLDFALPFQQNAMFAACFGEAGENRQCFEIYYNKKVLKNCVSVGLFPQHFIFSVIYEWGPQ